jgi:hypothetical protein
MSLTHAELGPQCCWLEQREDGIDRCVAVINQRHPGRATAVGCLSSVAGFEARRRAQPPFPSERTILLHRRRIRSCWSLPAPESSRSTATTPWVSFATPIRSRHSLPDAAHATYGYPIWRVLFCTAVECLTSCPPHLRTQCPSGSILAPQSSHCSDWQKWARYGRQSMAQVRRNRALGRVSD